MGTQHNLDSFTKIHLPPTYSIPSSSQTTTDARIIPMKITPSTPAHAPIYTSSTGEGSRSDIIKQEINTVKDPPKPRKKRGQYRKTILRQQAQAAAAAVAAGLPPPQFPPLKTKSRGQTQIQTQTQTQTGSSAAVTKGKAQADEPSSTSVAENLDAGSGKQVNDRASPTTLEMERELAMLAEEAEEDKRRREEEAADRILKRAQVVKHLRSLKSKLATAQIQIGHDLHYQSIDLFSELYDEVLEDIGRDNNSEMLNLLKSSLRDRKDSVSDEETESLTQNLGHMPTRSSDKPRKGDLIPNTSRTTESIAKDHVGDHTRHQLHSLEHEIDSDDTAGIKRIRRGRGSSQFIGQSWDVSSGRENAMASPTISGQNHRRSNPSKPITHLEDNDSFDLLNLRKYDGAAPNIVENIKQLREKLQLKQRRELEDLQSQQRRDQEELQRKQLDQLRELQERQNMELQEYDETKARQYREYLEVVAEKRLKPSLTNHVRKGESTIGRSRRRDPYISTSSAYEFDNGIQQHNGDYSSDHSRSPSPAPSQQQPTRSLDSHVSLTAHGSRSDHILPTRNTSSADPTKSTPKASRINSSINPLPMSTMTIALTAINEKKKQMKRAMRKQQGQEDMFDESIELSDFEEQSTTSNGRRFLSPPAPSQKRSAPDEVEDAKRNPSIAHSPLPHTPNSSSSQKRQHLASEYTAGRAGSHPLYSLKSHDLSSSQTHLISPEELSSPSSNFKSRKRKSPISPSTRTPSMSSTGVGNKSSTGLNKALLSQFDKWSTDEKTGSFLDFVLSDPPNIDLDDAEVEDLINDRKLPSGDDDEQHDLNATPTSSVFRWYQEQQKLAQELAHQSKMPSLPPADRDENENGHVHVENGGSGQNNEQGNDKSRSTLQLISGEDSSVASVQSRRRSHSGRKSSGAPASSSQEKRYQNGDQSSQDSNDNCIHQQGNEQDEFPLDSSPFLESSPATHLLYSGDGVEDWMFQPFSMDSAGSFLHNDSSMQSTEEYGHLI
ncbi:hypothetical protein BX616_001130 [Lobosporangium transversale]|uniref:Uncharacterized protein n=1 Tax=Lobosporangium transversale TaxID=64571 RepID=A0A1Y2GDQ2_9FUNG|nr:hypothetical protein BCR41DRAFT_424608 [Lobosporangium transversale]KAF9904996.1 hypothetical protein BX616_001130 [Lobosporangium transversale]ORZ07990.1 hypothetical protein BCR41DRAFT_424608 [Lobosporangium transversale]|eukprot:XP_021878224.1 hypothetical protein BCR41DRAFT_424608 [Lobosporangium transversale]